MQAAFGRVFAGDAFISDLPTVVFKDFVPGHTYKATVQLINRSFTGSSIRLQEVPTEVGIRHKGCCCKMQVMLALIRLQQPLGIAAIPPVLQEALLIGCGCNGAILMCCCNMVLKPCMLCNGMATAGFPNLQVMHVLELDMPPSGCLAPGAAATLKVTFKPQVNTC